VADTTGLQVAVAQSRSTKRPVSSKQRDLKTQSTVAVIRAAALRIIFSKTAFSYFHVFFYFMGEDIV